jgi:pimeloyl-ACP methyl ester carboxylesterase
MFWGVTTFYPAEPRKVELSDGYEVIYYSFIRGDQDSVDTFLFLIAGSTHASMAYSRYYLKDFPGHLRVFALQKRYISHRCSHASKPPDDYYRTHYLSSFQGDQIDFINTMLSREEKTPERVVVFGVSAGGTIAGAVSAQIPETTHLVVLGEGGMKGIDYFRTWGSTRGIDFDEIFEMVSQDPTTEKLWGGYTYRYWYELLTAEPINDLLRLEIPLLFAVGEDDELIESVRYLEAQFEEHGKRNLTTIVYPGCDHALEDSNGNSHRKEFLRDMHDWLHGREMSSAKWLGIERSAVRIRPAFDLALSTIHPSGVDKRDKR